MRQSSCESMFARLLVAISLFCFTLSFKLVKLKSGRVVTRPSICKEHAARVLGGSSLHHDWAKEDKGKTQRQVLDSHTPPLRRSQGDQHLLLHSFSSERLETKRESNSSRNGGA